MLHLILQVIDLVFCLLLFQFVLMMYQTAINIGYCWGTRYLKLQFGCVFSPDWVSSRCWVPSASME